MTIDIDADLRERCEQGAERLAACVARELRSRSALSRAEQHLAEAEAELDRRARNLQALRAAEVSKAAESYLNGAVPPYTPWLDDESAAVSAAEGRVSTARDVVQALRSQVTPDEAHTAEAERALKMVFSEADQRQRGAAFADHLADRARYLESGERLRDSYPDGLHVRLGDEQPIPAEVQSAIADLNRFSSDLQRTVIELQGFGRRRDRGAELRAELCARYLAPARQQATAEEAA